MKKFILGCLLIYSVLDFKAQGAEDKYELFYTRVEKAVQLAVQNLSDGCDPYGFSLLIKTSLTDENGGGAYMFSFDRDRVRQIVEDEAIKKLKFDIFDMEAQVEVAPGRAGIYYLHAGLAPPDAPQTGHEVFSDNFNLQIGSSTSGFQQIVVQVGAVFIVSKPNDGSINGSIYYVDAEGNSKPWNAAVFPGTSKAKVRYRRLGPGDDRTNSGFKEPESDWKFIGNPSYPEFLIDNRDPGHYYPSVKMRGCLQRYEDLEKDKDLEAIVKLTKSSVDWNDLHTINGVSTPTANLKAEEVKEKTIYTKYSTANTVKGKVLDASNKPVKGKKTIVLEPKDWEIPGKKPSEVITLDENFEFPEMVESGVYYLYVKGQPKKEIVEVCNCREKGEDANHTYTRNIGGSAELYVTVETIYTKTEDLDAQTAGSFGSSGTGKVEQVAKTKIVYHISQVELVDVSGGVTIAKSIGDYPIDSYSSTNGKLQIPRITNEGWKDETDSWKENDAPQAAFPRIYELNPVEQSGYQMNDQLSIIPLFDDPYTEQHQDLSGIKDEGAKKMVKTMEDLANALGPVADAAKDNVEEGIYIGKEKPSTFTFKQLYNVAKGTGQISLKDKTVQRIEAQVKGIQDMGVENSAGFEKMTEYYSPGSDIQKDLAGAGKLVNGGFNNFVMTNSYNRPVTTTVTRLITIRKATETEVEESKAPHSEELVREIPEEFLKEIRIIY